MIGTGEYISRADAIEAMYKDAEANPDHTFWVSQLEALIDIPAADVRHVVRGKWIPDYDYAEYDFDGSTPLSEPRKFQDGWKCSLCEGYMPFEANFCPNCGADMREKS